MTLPPFVYHLADAENLPSIERHGLFSTSALLDRIGIRGSKRAGIERAQRLSRTVLADGVVIRDQKPMPPEALQKCLVELTAAQWYRLLNGKVFFWFDLERLDNQRRACNSFPQVALKIATHRLLDRHAARAALTPINTGYARRKPAPRGAATFVPYSTWQNSVWSSAAEASGTLPRSRRPVELTIDTSVRDVMDFVVKVRRLAPNE